VTALASALILAAGIRRVKGVKKLGIPLVNWLTAEQGNALCKRPIVSDCSLCFLEREERAS
jgi:hypothetical protein